MKGIFHQLVAFLGRSKRTILLVCVVVVVTLFLSSIISIWLSRRTNLDLPSVGDIRTIGIEAYWDRQLNNRTEEVRWGRIILGYSENVTLYVRSISNIETTLNLEALDWTFYDSAKIAVEPPANISECINLSWDYNGTSVDPGEIIQLTLTLTTYYSDSFASYIVTNEVGSFSFTIIISVFE